MSEKIKITKIGRKSMPSKFKPGDTYNITTVMDEKSRKLVGMGPWTDNWKEGDEIEVIVTEKKWTDKDGFEQVGLNLTDPNKKAFVQRGGDGSTVSPLIVSYQLAASLAPLLFAGKKKVMLTDIDALAKELKSRIDVSATPAAPDVKEEAKVPVVDVAKEETPATPTETADDDEDETRPF